MTRFVWDKFSKDYLETFLSPYGEVKTGLDVTSETQEIDVWFIPKTSKIPAQLGLLGRGGTRNRAIDQLESLPTNDPLKSATLKLLYNLSKNLEALPKKTQEERKFIMRLTPLYEQECEQKFQQGLEQGLEQGRLQEIKLVIRLLNRRFGEIPSNITESIRQLSVEQLEDLGEALLDFDSQADLRQWLNNCSD